jgi:hypothetical protein
MTVLPDARRRSASSAAESLLGEHEAQRVERRVYVLDPGEVHLHNLATRNLPRPQLRCQLEHPH